MNWYYCNDGTTVVGPLPSEQLEALYHCGTINDETPVVAEGSTGWKSFEETFGVDSSRASKDAPDLSRTEFKQRAEAIFTTLAKMAGNIDFAAVLRWLASHKRVTIVSLLLMLVLGVKIHSKIEREQAGREFRERAIAQSKGWNSSPEDYFATEAAKMKRQLQESGDMEGDLFRIPCDRCQGYGQIPYNCGECGGSGVIVRGTGTELACPGCAGRGRVGRTCSKCDGEGKVLSDKPY
jgi:hypothetical protein